jgi:hypothetical protein
VEKLVQEAWQWHLAEEARVEMTSLEASGLQRQDKTVVFGHSKMVGTRTTRSNKGGNASDTNDEKKDIQMVEATT